MATSATTSAERLNPADLRDGWLNRRYKIMKTENETEGQPQVGSDALLAPFVLWGDRYYGLCVQDGSVTTKPDENKEWTEYHLDYRGGDIWEIEVCPSENTGWTVWRGKLPSREIFVTIMQNIEDAPPIDWANELGVPPLGRNGTQKPE